MRACARCAATPNSRSDTAGHCQPSLQPFGAAVVEALSSVGAKARTRPYGLRQAAEGIRDEMPLVSVKDNW